MRALLTTLLLTLATASAHAEKIPTGEGSDVAGVPRGSCDISSYKGYDSGIAPTTIPDNDPTGLVIGPISTGAPAGPGILDVVVELGFAHTWLGDLIIDVTYDGDCDGLDGDDDTTVGIMCRPGRDCGGPGTSGFGCDTDASDTYLFTDAGDDTWDDSCPGTLAPTCLAPDNDAAATSSLDDFNGLLKGGCFYVVVSDNAGGDTGMVSRLTVFTLNDTGVPTETTSWGAIKSRF